MSLSNRVSRNCELVIFDCDGVLVDSEILVAKTYSRTFESAGIRISEDDLLCRFVGISDADMFRTLEQETGIKLSGHLDGLTQSLVLEVLEKELQAIPGIHELLADLTLPACVASSSTPVKLEHSLSLVGLHEHFAPNIFSSMMVANGKPAPDLFLLAAERMGCAPERSLVIEDSIAGVRSALAAGMPVIGFAGASHCNDGHAAALKLAGAIETAHSMQELRAVLRRVAGR